MKSFVSEQRAAYLQRILPFRHYNRPRVSGRAGWGFWKKQGVLWHLQERSNIIYKIYSKSGKWYANKHCLPVCFNILTIDVFLLKNIVK